MPDKEFRFTEQTTKQPIRFRCGNQECKTGTGLRDYFEFVSDYPVCPKCKASWPVVDKISLTHFLIPNQNGRITGQHGIRYSICCDPRRYDIATTKNGEAASGDVNQVNCRGCLIEIKKLRIKLGIDQEKLISA